MRSVAVKTQKCKLNVIPGGGRIGGRGVGLALAPGMAQFDLRLLPKEVEGGNVCGGGSPQPQTGMMGDTEQFDDPKPVAPKPPVSSAKNREVEPSKPAFEPGFGEAESPTGSVPLSQGRPPVRRSSLRPAPPSFRPSSRDASQLRPAMVIHAGDVEPSGASWDIPEPPPSQTSQVPLDSAARAEPFALAEDLAAKASADTTLPLVIPPPGGLPREALAATEKQPSDALPAKQQLRRNAAAIVIAAGLVGVVAMTMLGHRHHASPKLEPGAARVSAAAPLEVPTPVETPSAQTNAAEPAALGAASAAPMPPVAATTAPAVPAAPLAGTTQVTLELKPTDAKVLSHGAVVPGPPFIFDVPKGQHIVVEAVRPGFAARKITIDDKKQVISIGLLRATAAPRHQR